MNKQAPEEEILEARRKPSYQLPKRSWVQRNPRLFQSIFITTSLLVFFSKPLYDLFTMPDLPDLSEPPTPKPAHKR